MCLLRPLAVAVIVVWLSVFSPAAAAPSTVVYNNTTTPAPGSWTPDGFWPFSWYAPYEPTGQTVTLAGTERTITRIELILSSTGTTTVSSVNLQLRLNNGPDYNGAPGAPGWVCWSGTVTNVVVSGPTTVGFDISNVQLPDSSSQMPGTFSWIAVADSLQAGLATFGPPTVGTSASDCWDYNLTPPMVGWNSMDFEGDPVANFGIKIYAVPEPVTMSIMATGALLLLRRSRRPGVGRHSPS